MSFSLLLRHKWLTCFSIVRLPRFWHQVQFYKSSTFSQILCRPEDPTLHIPFPLYTFSFFTMLTSPHTHEKKNTFVAPAANIVLYCFALQALPAAWQRHWCVALSPWVPVESLSRLDRYSRWPSLESLCLRLLSHGPEQPTDPCECTLCTLASPGGVEPE